MRMVGMLLDSRSGTLEFRLTFGPISTIILRMESEASLALAIGASRRSSTLFVLFIPSRTRGDAPIDQKFWVREALSVLGRLFGGATAYPKGEGVWLDKEQDTEQGGKLLFDEPVVVQSYTSEEAILAEKDALRSFLIRLGSEAKQAAVGFVIDRDYMEIQFDSEGRPLP